MLTKKTDDNGEDKLEARFCAQGAAHEDQQVDRLTTGSPTASRASMRFVLSTAATNKWHVYSFDVSCAYPHGQFLEEDQDENTYGADNGEVYLKPPKEFREDGYIVRLKKVVYGYAGAPRRWFNAGGGSLMEIGMTPVGVDPAAYVSKQKGELTAGPCMRVDGGVFTCSERGMEAIRKYMELFTVGKPRVGDFTCTGEKVARGGNGDIVLSQTDYVRRLREIGLEKERLPRKRAWGKL